MLKEARAMARRATAVGDDGTNDGKLDQSAKTRAGEAAEIQQACGTP